MSEISQKDAQSYMRCFMDMCRRMGVVGERLGCHEDADPEDIIDEARMHASFVERIIRYSDAGDLDLIRTAVARWREAHADAPTPSDHHREKT